MSQAAALLIPRGTQVPLTPDDVIRSYQCAHANRPNSDKLPARAQYLRMEQSALHTLLLWSQETRDLERMVANKLQKFMGMFVFGSPEPGRRVPLEILRRIALEMHQQLTRDNFPQEVSNPGGFLWRCAEYARRTLVRQLISESRMVPSSQIGDEPGVGVEHIADKQAQERSINPEPDFASSFGVKDDLESCKGQLEPQRRDILDAYLVGISQQQIGRDQDLHHSNIGRHLTAALRIIIACMRKKGWPALYITPRELQTGADRTGHESPY